MLLRINEVWKGANMMDTKFKSADVWDKVYGKAAFGADMPSTGMLHGKILRSPHPHARIKSIHTKKAMGLPGVKAVLTGADNTLPPFGIANKDEHILAKGFVRYIGDEVAAVAAVDEETAQKALSLIDVEYELLPAVFDPFSAAEQDAPQVHAQYPLNTAWERTLERGDTRQAFDNAHLVVDETFTTQAVHPTYLEPTVCTARIDSYQGIVLETAVQSPHMLRNLMSLALQVEPSRIRIICPHMGGGFGGKVFGNYKLFLTACLLTLETGVAVRMHLTREEEFIVGRPRAETTFRIKLAMDREGNILARHTDIMVDNGAYSAQMPFVAKTLSERNDSLYRIYNLHTTAKLVCTNKVPTGQYRSFGNAIANFAMESILDEAAMRLSIDPLAIRLKNCTREGDTTVHGLIIKSCGLPDCLERAAAEIGWGKRKPGIGVGISCAIHLNGNTAGFPGFSGASATIRLEEDGRITIFTGEQDYGQGTHAAFAQIAANVLGVSPQQVVLQSKDTAITPFSIGAFACRQLTIGGNAVKLAAENLLREIVTAATDLLGDGAVFSESQALGVDGSKLTLAQLARAAMYQRSGMPLTAEGNYTPPDTTTANEQGMGNISATYSFAAHAAEVEVDLDTGSFRVTRLVAAHDSGRIINLHSSLGQVYGGVAQGLGYGCLEGYVFENGRVLNPDLASYRIPTSLDMPMVTPIFIENPDPVGPYGAKGIGEIVQVPTAAAVANALAAATGARVRQLPLTPERVYWAIRGEVCPI
jgi:CO/xanthine dehydrogenase Mo-binding subunit